MTADWRESHDLEVDVVALAPDGQGVTRAAGSVPTYRGQYVPFAETAPAADPPDPECVFCFAPANKWTIRFEQLDDPSRGIVEQAGCCARCRRLVLESDWTGLATLHAEQRPDAVSAAQAFIALAHAQFIGVERRGDSAVSLG